MNRNLESLFKKLKSKPKVLGKYDVSYPDKEFECKISFDQVGLNKIIRFILESVKNKKITLDDIVLRKEYHHFYEDKKTHRAFIFASESKEVWIKKKVTQTLFAHPNIKFPY